MCLPPERLSPAAGSSSRSSTPTSDLRGRLSPQLAEALAAVEDATDDLLPDLSEQCARAVAPAGEEDVFLELRWHEEDSGPVLFGSTSYGRTRKIGILCYDRRNASGVHCIDKAML